MSRKKQQEEEVVITQVIYSNEELLTFSNFLDRFRVEKEVGILKKSLEEVDVTHPVTKELVKVQRPVMKATNVEKVKVIDTNAALKEYGAISSKGLVISLRDGKWSCWAYKDFMEKSEQLSKMKARRDYARQKEVEELTKMAAENMNVHE
jgi:hypothetical protein